MKDHQPTSCVYIESSCNYQTQSQLFYISELMPKQVEVYIHTTEALFIYLFIFAFKNLGQLHAFFYVFVNEMYRKLILKCIIISRRENISFE